MEVLIALLYKYMFQVKQGLMIRVLKASSPSSSQVWYPFSVVLHIAAGKLLKLGLVFFFMQQALRSLVSIYIISGGASCWSLYWFGKPKLCRVRLQPTQNAATAAAAFLALRGSFFTHIAMYLLTTSETGIYIRQSPRPRLFCPASRGGLPPPLHQQIFKPWLAHTCHKK